MSISIADGSKSAVAFGYGVSLRLPPGLGKDSSPNATAYLSSPGQADPRLMARRFDTETTIPMLQFDRCVFTLEPAGPPPSQLRSMAEQAARKGGDFTLEKKKAKPSANSDISPSEALLEQITEDLRRESEGQSVTYGRSVCLVHVYSGLYLAVVRKPAEDNPAHFRVALMPKADAGATCRFKLMPRYKIRADGDPIMDMDMVMLEHESGSLGLFASIPCGAHDEVEATACSSAVPLEIGMYDEPNTGTPEERQTVLRGGAAALLFHREKDALLFIDGSTHNDVPPPEKEDSPSPLTRKSSSRHRAASRVAIDSEPTMHKNTPLFRHFSQPVTSLSPDHLEFGSSAMWFFEHADTRCGAPITCRQPIRLRHGSTGRYLCVSKSKRTHVDSTGYDVTTQPLDTIDIAEASILELEFVSSYNRGRLLISTKTFVRVRHVASGLYISSKPHGHLSSSLVLTTQPMLDDTLTFILVSQVRQEELSFLIGNAEFLSNYIKVFYQMQERFCSLTHNSPWVLRIVSRTISSLESLIRFCTESDSNDMLTREGIPISSHQDSMFEMDLHHTVMEVMVAPFVSSSKLNKLEMPLEGGALDFKHIADHPSIFRINRLCYRLLKQMCKGSKYSYKLLEFIDFMQQQEGYKLHISDTLAEILTDNVCLSAEQSSKDIRHNVNLLLTKDRSAGYINFLKLLCVVGETGVVENQRLVSHLVLEQHRDEILLRVTLSHEDVLMVLVPGNKKTDTDPKWMPLSDFLRFSDDKKNKLGKFFEASIDLLGALCIGGDERVLQRVADTLSMKILSAFLKPTFPASDSLRSSFIKLGHHLYIRRYLHRRGCSSGDVYSCGELVLKPPSAVTNHSELLTPKEEEVKSMLRLCSHESVVAEGMCASDEGAGGDCSSSTDDADVPSPAVDEENKADEAFLQSMKESSLTFLQTNKRMSSNEGHSRFILAISNLWHSLVVYHAYTAEELEKTVQAVILALDPATDEPVNNRHKVTEKSIVLIQTKQGLLRFLSAVMSYELRGIADSTLHKCVVSGPSEAVSSAKASVTSMCESLFRQESLFRVLLDLISYEDTELVKLSVELALQLCNSYGYVADRVCSAETITDADGILYFMRFRTVLRSLQKNVSPAGNIINEEAVVDAIKRLLAPVEHSSPSKYLRSQMAEQQKASAASSPNHSSPGLKSVDTISPSKLRLAVRSMVGASIMNKGAASKRKSWRIEPTAEVRAYCGLLSRAGIEEMLQKSLSLMAPETSLCYTILDFYKILTTSRDAAQKLSTRIDLFLPFLEHDSTKLDAATIILALVKRNTKLAVTLSSDTVVRLVSLLHRDDTGILAQGLENVVLGEFPIPENQKAVLIGIGSPGVVDANRSWSAAKLSANSAIVNLMSCCCVNNSNCRGIISSNIAAGDVLKVLLSDHLPPAHVYPFFKLFTAAFLAFEDEWTAQEISSLKREWAKNADWWDLVRKMLDSLPKMGDFARSPARKASAVSLSPVRGSKTPVKGGDGSPTSKTPISAPAVAPAAPPTLPLRANNNDAPKDTPIDDVCLPLIFEGAIPCLATYFQNLYSPSSATSAPQDVSLVAIHMRTIVQDIVPFFGWVVEYGTELPVEYLLGVHNLAVALAPYSHTTTLDELYTSHLTQFADAIYKRANIIKDKGMSDKADQRQHLEGVSVFAEQLPGVNTQSALMPFIELINGNQPLHVVATTTNRARAIHTKLVARMRSWDFDERALVGLMSAFRHALSADEGHLVAAQSYLNDIDVLRMVTDVVAGRFKGVANEAYQLGVAILEGGNKAVQDSLLHYLGHNDERFFQDVEDVINGAIRKGRERRTRAANATYYHVSSERMVLDFGNINVIFRFLQLLCEGHHFGLQQYLREQYDNLKSVNIVKAVSLFFCELLSTPAILDSADNIALLLQTLALLTEMCQGPCRGNQDIIVNLGVCAVLNAFLTNPAYAVPLDALAEEDESALSRLEIKQNAVTLLLALLEGSVDGNLPILVMKEVPLTGIDAVLGVYIGSDLFLKQACDGLSELVYGLIVMVNTCINSITAKVNEDREVGKAIIDKYSKHVGLLGKIEIERQNRIERVYFRVPQMSQSLSEESKEKLIWSVDRSTQGSKLSDFLDKADEIIYDIESSHNATAKLRESRFFKSMARFPLPFWDDVTLVLALVMNLLFVVVMADARNLMDDKLELFGVEGILLLLAILQVLSTFVSMFLDGFLNYPLVIYKVRKELKIEPTIWEKVYAIGTRRETTFRILYFAIALAGLTVSDFFFAFHLLGIISRISILKNVVVAVTLNGKSLLLTGLLGCIFVYLFSIVAFIAFQDHFDESTCKNLAGCALHILTTGLRQGGGIGDQMNPIKPGEPGYYPRVIYDFLFWAIMIVIFLNILFGIIIDTFAELRDERSKKEEDMRTLCFVCGINSFTFDKNGIPFSKHVKEEHNMWQYLYFFHHLQQKEPTEYTGQESYVADCIARRDIGFFPNGKCCSLSEVDLLTGEGDDGGSKGASSESVAAALNDVLVAHFSNGTTTDRAGPTHESHDGQVADSDLLGAAFQGSVSTFGGGGMEVGMTLLTKILGKVEALEQSSHGGSSGNDRKLDAIMARHRLNKNGTVIGGGDEGTSELRDALVKALTDADAAHEALFVYKQGSTLCTSDIVNRYTKFVESAFALQEATISKKHNLYSQTIAQRTSDLQAQLYATLDANNRLASEVEGLHTKLQKSKLHGDQGDESKGSGGTLSPRDRESTEAVMATGREYLAAMHRVVQESKAARRAVTPPAGSASRSAPLASQSPRVKSTTNGTSSAAPHARTLDFTGASPPPRAPAALPPMHPTKH